MITTSITPNATLNQVVLMIFTILFSPFILLLPLRTIAMDAAPELDIQYAGHLMKQEVTDVQHIW